MMKNSFKTYIGLLTIAIFVCSCGGGGGDDTPPAPAANEAPSTVENLIFPSANLLCIDNNIDFDWDDAVDPEGGTVRYRILIARDRDLTQIEEERIVTQSQVTITLERAVAFYWNVVSLDNANAESEPTPTQAFFTMGDGIANNVPFTAALIAPEDGGTVTAGTTNLSWEGGDTDVDDVLTFDLFFGTEADPPLLQEGLDVENFDVMTTTGNTYFWRIDSIDDSGARSIGQVWQFTAN